jgi:plasmid replication initiation protein
MSFNLLYIGAPGGPLASRRLPRIRTHIRLIRSPVIRLDRKSQLSIIGTIRSKAENEESSWIVANREVLGID